MRRLEIAKQSVMYNKVSWVKSTSAEVPVVDQEMIIIPPTIDRKPTNLFRLISLGDRMPYWSFKYQIVSGVGLIIKNLVIQDFPQYPGNNEKKETVLESITFHDVNVVLEDGRKFDLDLTKTSLQQGKFYFGENGTLRQDPQDKLYQYGMKLVVNQNLGGICPIQVTFSVVLRGPAADQDPGRFAVAMRIYPEIGITILGSKKNVKTLNGTVKLVTNLPETSEGKSNVASFFTDSNTSHEDKRERLSLAKFILWKDGETIPVWHNLFDYNLLDLKKEKVIRGAIPAGKATDRERIYQWPSKSNAWIRVRRLPRQGAYDNLHIHSQMPASTNEDVGVHAPFACFRTLHTHWRWSKFNVEVASKLGGKPSDFKGWGFDARAGIWSPNTGLGAPMIPPNQLLTVALTNPEAVRIDDGDFQGTKSLSSSRKAFWYSVEIDNPNPRRENVIFPHGTAYAIGYNQEIKSGYKKIAQLHFGLRLKTINTDNLGDPDVIHDLFVGLYNGLRYFDESEYVSQVPQGDYDNNGNTAPMEDL